MEAMVGAKYTDVLEPHPDKTSSVFVVIGSPASPYSLKVRAAFRYLRIPFRWVNRGGRDDVGYARPKGPPLLPNVICPGGEAVGDSTPILERFGNGERSLFPPNEVENFFNKLIEDFADEWMTKMMYHYRWAHSPNDKNAAATLPHFMVDIKNKKQEENLARIIGKRQISRLGLVGSNPDSKDAIEKSFEILLEVLAELLGESPFLFGNRPSLADFGVYGQLTQLVRFDETAVSFSYKKSPSVVAWVWKMDDLSGNAALSSDWQQTSGSPAFRKLLTLIGATYVPLVLANQSAISLKSKTATVSSPLGTWTQPSFKYQAKCAANMQRAFSELSPSSREEASKKMAGTGCEKLFMGTGKL
eukprot:TRINITY_DN11985_c0_g1_i2.p1 TRINITY_DN11985_c0_g1~~TRINITY_DN11985_c0_g1_i2.p1  ORF type:complete len:359 (+),score=83.49 TRINITY_DN11985_c0_g1_i2:63-1139(+)